MYRGIDWNDLPEEWLKDAYARVGEDAVGPRPGEPLYKVPYYQPTYRLAARVDGGIVEYEAHEGGRGSDLLDLRRQVTAIDVKGGAGVARITEPVKVARLTEMVLNAPVDWTLQARTPNRTSRIPLGVLLEQGEHDAVLVPDVVVLPREFWALAGVPADTKPIHHR